MATFDPVSITVGTTAYTLTGAQVALAAAGIAGLAIAKKALLVAALSRGRGRRDISQNLVSQTPINFAPMFDSIAQQDVADCGKLLVCTAMAKTEGDLNSEEKLITELFDDLEHIDPNTGYAEYQVAAYAGTFKQPEICLARYSRCPISTSDLGTLIKVQN